MPGLLENRRKWAGHDWRHGGHRWSPGGTPAGTDMLWRRAVRPRIQAWLPADAILEIAPGTGRWTAYLLAECRRLTGVDITPECIDACRVRFADRPDAAFHVNDGESLPDVPDASIDLAFSFDSLVHVEAPQLRQYARELARTLTPGGAAFLHHSNLGAYADARTGRVAARVRERHWRAPSVSAAVFRSICRDVGLLCRSQELVNWIGRDAEVDRHRLPAAQIPLTDCFTLCVRPPGAGAPASRTHVVVNFGFVEEWRQLVALAGADALGPRTTQAASPEGRWYAGLRARLNGLLMRDPVARALRSGRCPDCGQVAQRNADSLACRHCGVVFDRAGAPRGSDREPDVI